MKCAKLLPLVMVVAQAGLPAAARADGQTGSRGGRYTIVVEGYDWGAGVEQGDPLDGQGASSASARDYAVAVRRTTECGPLTPSRPRASRLVVDAYVSDERGAKRDEGRLRHARPGRGPRLDPGLSPPVRARRQVPRERLGGLRPDRHEKASGRAGQGGTAASARSSIASTSRASSSRVRQDAVLRLVHSAARAARSPRS